jgi:hypothetical protein
VRPQFSAMLVLYDKNAINKLTVVIPVLKKTVNMLVDATHGGRPW